MCAIANVASVISIFNLPWNFTPSINLAHTFCRYIFAYTILYTKMPIAHFVEHFGKRKRATQGEREICFPHAVLALLYTHCWDITYG